VEPTIFKPRLKFKPPLKFFKFGHRSNKEAMEPEEPGEPKEPEEPGKPRIKGKTYL